MRDNSRTPGPFRVYVGLVPTGYLSRAAIEQTVANGLLFCGQPSLRPGPALILSDVEMAHAKWARHSYTHPEVIRAVAKTQKGGHVQVVAKGASGLSTHRIFLRAHGNSERFLVRGYYELERELAGRVSVKAWEDLPCARYCLSKRPSPQRSEIEELQAYSSGAPLILCPKLKTDLLFDGLSGSLALLAHHDPEANAAEMLEIANPALVVSDGIIAAVGPNRNTGRGHELGVILVANNAVAHDLAFAKILNLDVSLVSHLKHAIAEGWGPGHLQEVELGGAALDGIQSLATKTRFWKLGLHSFAGFSERFQAEHPGFRLRLQNALEDEQQVAPGPQERSLVSWLFKTYDFPKTAMRLAFWPQTKILFQASSVRKILSASLPRTLLTIGSPATESFRKAVANTFWEFPFWGLRLPHSITIASVQLRNGARLIWFALPAGASALAQTNALSWLFALARGGKMTWHLLRPSYLLDKVTALAQRFLKRKNPLHAPRVLTSRLPHNAWWIAPIQAPSPSAEEGRPLPRPPVQPL